MLNSERFNKLFGGYSSEVRSLIMSQLSDSGKDCVLGLDEVESKALRDYLGVDNKCNCAGGVRDIGIIPPMAKVSRKLMAGVMSQTYLIEIEKAKNELSKVMDIRVLKQVNVVSKHTTGELMDMYGIAAYPLLQIASENKIYPLPDLSPNGSIRPFIGIESAGLSESLSKSLIRASRGYDRTYSCYGNINSVLVMDDDDILKLRNIGKTRFAEINERRNLVATCYPEHYKRLVELREHAITSSYFKSGSREEFAEFKKECELRKLINFDDEESLKMSEDYTESQLRLMFGDLYDVFEMKCKRTGIYPLPEFDSTGDIVRKHKISDVLIGCSVACSNKGIQYVHQLFELNDDEMQEWLCSIDDYFRGSAVKFVDDVRERYPRHVEVLNDARAKRCEKTCMSNK